MNISEQEKELLYQEFLERMNAEGINTKTEAYRNLHNLERAREHFKLRMEDIRKNFDFGLWSKEGLNWPDWTNQITRLICHVYGVSRCGQIQEFELDRANDLAIKIIDELIDENIKHLESRK